MDYQLPPKQPPATSNANVPRGPQPGPVKRPGETPQTASGRAVGVPSDQDKRKAALELFRQSLARNPGTSALMRQDQEPPTLAPKPRSAETQAKASVAAAHPAKASAPSSRTVASTAPMPPLQDDPGPPPPKYIPAPPPDLSDSESDGPPAPDYIPDSPRTAAERRFPARGEEKAMAGSERPPLTRLGRFTASSMPGREDRRSAGMRRQPKSLERREEQPNARRWADSHSQRSALARPFDSAMPSDDERMQASGDEEHIGNEKRPQNPEESLAADHADWRDSEMDDSVPAPDSAKKIKQTRAFRSAFAPLLKSGGSGKSIVYDRQTEKFRFAGSASRRTRVIFAELLGVSAEEAFTSVFSGDMISPSQKIALKGAATKLSERVFDEVHRMVPPEGLTTKTVKDPEIHERVNKLVCEEVRKFEAEKSHSETSSDKRLDAQFRLANLADPPDVFVRNDHFKTHIGNALEGMADDQFVGMEGEKTKARLKTMSEKQLDHFLSLNAARMHYEIGDRPDDPLNMISTPNRLEIGICVQFISDRMLEALKKEMFDLATNLVKKEKGAAKEEKEEIPIEARNLLYEFEKNYKELVVAIVGACLNQRKDDFSFQPPPTVGDVRRAVKEVSKLVPLLRKWIKEQSEKKAFASEESSEEETDTRVERELKDVKNKTNKYLAGPSRRSS